MNKQCRGLIALAKNKGMERQFGMDLVELGLDEHGPLRQMGNWTKRQTIRNAKLQNIASTRQISALQSPKLQVFNTQANLFPQTSKDLRFGAYDMYSR